MEKKQPNEVASFGNSKEELNQAGVNAARLLTAAGSEGKLVAFAVFVVCEDGQGRAMIGCSPSYATTFARGVSENALRYALTSIQGGRS